MNYQTVVLGVAVFAAASFAATPRPAVAAASPYDVQLEASPCAYIAGDVLGQCDNGPSSFAEFSTKQGPTHVSGREIPSSPRGPAAVEIDSSGSLTQTATAGTMNFSSTFQGQVLKTGTEAD